MTQTDYPVGQWIGWNGGECPVHPETVVDFVPCDGMRSEMQASLVAWGSQHHIIAFRIVIPYVEPAPKLECWVWLDPDGQVSAFDDIEDAAEAAEAWGGTIHRMVEADG